MRSALGASRGALDRPILTESLVLAAAGGALGLLLSGWTTSLLLEILPPEGIGRVVLSTPDWRLLVFAFLLRWERVGAVCDRPNQVPILERAVIDCTYSGSGSGVPKSFNFENVGAVYDRPNQVRIMTAQINATARIKSQFEIVQS